MREEQQMYSTQSCEEHLTLFHVTFLSLSWRHVGLANTSLGGKRNYLDGVTQWLNVQVETSGIPWDLVLFKTLVVIWIVELTALPAKTVWATEVTLLYSALMRLSLEFCVQL